MSEPTRDPELQSLLSQLSELKTIQRTIDDNVRRTTVHGAGKSILIDIGDTKPLLALLQAKIHALTEVALGVMTPAEKTRRLIASLDIFEQPTDTEEPSDG